MGNMYDRINFLCRGKGETITTMCKNLSLSRSILSEYKSGRTKSIKSDVLSNIARYLDTSIDYLLTGEEQKNSPPDETGGLKDEVLAILRNLPEEKRADVLEYGQYLLEKYKNESK